MNGTLSMPFSLFAEDSISLYGASQGEHVSNHEQERVPFGMAAQRDLSDASDCRPNCPWNQGVAGALNLDSATI